jgi:quercetin dioxygenase-like cupin family protein
MGGETTRPHAHSALCRVGGRVVHGGHEFVCCMKGTLQYEVDETAYLLRPGDMLLVEAALPHSWAEPREEEAQFLLVLHTPDRPTDSVRWHFMDHPAVEHMG